MPMLEILTMGAVHKVRHALFGQFLPPVILRHTSSYQSTTSTLWIVSNCYPLRHLRQNRGRIERQNILLNCVYIALTIHICFILFYFFNLLPLILLLLICFITTLCM